MSDIVQQVTEQDFDSKVLQADKPVLVDFWAEWCSPCKMIAPVLEEIATEYAERLVIMKLNIDLNPNIAPKYGIRGIPTLLLFKKGTVVATKVGALNKAKLKEFIDTEI